MLTLRRRVSTSFLLLSVIISPVFAAEPALWQYVYPNSKALVGVHWSAVRQSDVGRWIAQRWIDDTNMPGTEFLNSVEDVLISSSGSAPGSGTEPPILIAVRGAFDLAKVEKQLIQQGTKRQMFGAIPVFRPQARSDSGPSFALLSTQTILIGDAQALFSTIERSRLEVAVEDPNVFTNRAQTLSTRYEIWAVMNDRAAMKNFLFASLAGKALSGNARADSQRFEAGISFREGLSIDVTMTSPDERAAQTLKSSLSKMIDLAAKDQSQSGGLVALLAKLKVSTDRTTVAMNLHLNQQEVDSSLRREPKAVTPLLASTTPPVPVEPKKMVIRIDGLDDGPKELPFKP